MARFTQCLLAAYVLVALSTEAADPRVQIRLVVATVKGLLKRCLHRTLGNPNHCLRDTWTEECRIDNEFVELIRE